MEQVNVYSIKHYKISGMFLKPRLNLVSFTATLEKRRETNPNPTKTTKIHEILTAEMMGVSD